MMPEFFKGRILPRKCKNIFNLGLRVRESFKFLVAKLRETLPRVFVPAENDSDKISGRSDRY